MRSQANEAASLDVPTMGSSIRMPLDLPMVSSMRLGAPMQLEPEMLTFRVDDMSCGHCVRAIKQAVRALDADAAVDVDLSRHLVRVQAGRLAAPVVRQALQQAGYSPVDLVTAEPTPAAAAGCCGCVGARCACAA
jgi:copper chaperone